MKPNKVTTKRNKKLIY